IRHEVQAQGINHYTVQRVLDVNCDVEGRDLGSVSAAVQRKVDQLRGVPRGTSVKILGQSEAMHASFGSMGSGLLLAIVLVYLLMATNFQSWLDPFIIMMAVPGALAGVLWMLIATRTTLNVESLMGTIMAVGVGVANGNLLITFADDLRSQGRGAMEAAVEAATVRMRPVLMTALAMILGMLPDVAGARRRRRAECAAWPRRDWRSDRGDRNDPVRGSDSLLAIHAEAAGKKAARYYGRRDG